MESGSITATTTITVTYIHIVLKFLWINSRLVVQSSISFCDSNTASTGAVEVTHRVQSNVAKALYDERFVGEPRRHMDGRHVTCLVHEIA